VFHYKASATGPASRTRRVPRRPSLGPFSSRGRWPTGSRPPR